MLALKALRARKAQWTEVAQNAPNAVAAAAEGWVRLRGRVRPGGGSGPIAVLERRRVDGMSVVTADVANFEFVDETGSVLIGSQAFAIEVIGADLPHGQWRQEVTHGDPVLLVAEVGALGGEGPHRTAKRQVLSSVSRPALLFMVRE